jgi:hypothetical protein
VCVDTSETGQHMKETIDCIHYPWVHEGWHGMALDSQLVVAWRSGVWSFLFYVFGMMNVVSRIRTEDW